MEFGRSGAGAANPQSALIFWDKPSSASGGSTGLPSGPTSGASTWFGSMFAPLSPAYGWFGSYGIICALAVIDCPACGAAAGAFWPTGFTVPR